MARWKEQTIGDMLDNVAAKYPDTEIMIEKDRRITYREFREKVDSIAKGLLKLGVERNDKISIWLPNSIEWMSIFFAISKLGAVSVPINTRFKSSELEYVVRQSDSIGIFMADRFLNIDYLSIIKEAIPEVDEYEPERLSSGRFPLLRRIVCLGKDKSKAMWSWGDFLSLGNEIGLKGKLNKRQASIGHDDLAVIQYTSGSTAFPKGAMLTHNNIARDGFEIGERLRIKVGDRYFTECPFYHSAGLVNCFLAAVTHGACLVFTDHFDAEESLRMIEKEKCTIIGGVQTMYTMKMAHENFGKYDISSLRAGWTTGTPQITQDVYYKIGVKGISNIYGLSEASPNCTHCDVEQDPVEIRLKTMGKPQPGVEIKIIDPETGDSLPTGAKGEIYVRGWNVMKGYYKKEKETRETLDSERWLHTGDLGFFDSDGFLIFIGRVKNVIRVGGENVSCEEVENSVYQHPKVKQVEVIGVPDDRLGEVAVTFIELKEGETCTEEEIINFCKGKMANFKVPRNVRFVTGWPMTGSGKVQKFKLKEDFMKE